MAEICPGFQRDPNAGSDESNAGDDGVKDGGEVEDDA